MYRDESEEASGMIRLFLFSFFKERRFRVQGLGFRV